MIVHKAKEIEYSDEITFKGIPKDKYHEEIAKLDEKIQKDMLENLIAEQKSNEAEKHFHTTVVQPFNEEIEY